MKIRSLYIDGFGKFHDWKPPTRFGEALTVIVGPNEAGKTTLLAFIRRMLYGFPDGRRNLNHYRPLSGGRPGGRLDLQWVDGQDYTLTRTGVKGLPSLTLADGTAAKGLEPGSLLGPCDQVFYENVCAIGLDELQAISTLEADEIRDRLAAAGAGNLPVRETATSLQDAAGEIYVVKGSVRKINTLVTELKSVEKRIRDVKRGQEKYDEINSAIARESEAVRVMVENKRAIEEEIVYLEALGRAWEVFIEREEALRALQEIPEIPEIDPFPADALESLSRIEAEVQGLGEECQNLAGERDRLREEVDRCTLREEILNEADTIRALERRVERYKTRIDDLKDAQREVDQQQASLAEVLKSLGGDRDEERIMRFDTSAPAKDDVRNLRDRLTKAENNCVAGQSRLGAAEREADAKRESLMDLQRRRQDMGDPEDPETARRRLGLARELQSEIRSLQDLETRLHAIRQEEARVAEIRASIHSARAVPAWPGIVVALSAVLVFGWGYLTETLQIAGIIALLLLAAAAGIFLAGRRETESVDHGEGETLASQKEEAERERSVREERAAGHAAALGLDSLPAQAAADALVHALEDAVREADGASGLDKEIGRAREHCDNASAALERARQIMNDTLLERENAQSLWRQWCRERDLPGTMNPDLMPEFIADIRRAAGLYTQIRAAEKKQESLAEEIQSFEEEIAAVAHACNESLSAPPDTVLEGLVRLLREEEEAKRRYDTLRQQLHDKEEALERVSARYNAATASLEAMLRERDAGTPAEYREFERLSRERARLDASIWDAESAIRRISGEERYQDFIAALQEYDPVTMLIHLQEKEESLPGIQDRINEINQEIGTLREQRSRIEGDDDLTLLLSREAALREEIRQVSRQWAVYTTASHLLAMAVETFERERQPEILREAQSFFTRITDGRYTRVVKPVDGSDIYIEEATGGRKKIDELSRGTAEQLYLALRFGYIRDYARSSAPVPVVFDDILVNFDPERRKNACRAIADLAETCQILYFTCHPQTVDDLVEARPDAVVMDIGE